MDQDVSFGETATFNCIASGVGIEITWTFNNILSCTAMSCNLSGLSVNESRSETASDSTVNSVLVVDTSQLEVETTYTIQCILQQPIPSGNGDQFSSASLRVTNSTEIVSSRGSGITGIIIGAVVASLIIVVFIIIGIIAIIVVTKSKRRRNEFPMYEEIGMYTKCIAANHEYDKINDLMPNSSGRFNTEAAHVYDRISNCSFSYSSEPEYENVLLMGLLDYPEGTRRYGIYEKVPDVDMAHIVRQASLEAQQMYEVIARYERVPHVDMAQILKQISRSSEERAHVRMYEEMSAYERVPHVDMAQILNQISRSSEERAHVRMYEEMSAYERVPHVDMAQILNQISRSSEERAHVRMYEEMSAYEQVPQVDMAQILKQISRSSEERAHVRMYEEMSAYERVPHVDMAQILNQISRSRVHLQEMSAYERVPHVDMAQILNQISRYREERAHVQEMSAYERVPHADVTDMNPYKLYTSRVSGSGVDTGYSDYERAQVYGQITGYEQVPVADIAQIVSTHATKYRCSAPNMEIPEVNMPQNALITAVCEQDMIPASAQVAPLYTRTQCSKEDSPVSLSAGVVARIPDSYGKRKQNETINSVQWMVNKLKLRVAHSKLDSIQHITGHGHVDHNSSAGDVLSTSTHYLAFDTTPTQELTSSYESSPQAAFPLHEASKIPHESNLPVEQLNSEYERIKYTTLAGGLSSSSPAEQFSGYERANYTSFTGGLSSNYTCESKLPVKQFSEYERVNYTSIAGRLLRSSSGGQFSGYERVNYTSSTGRVSSNYNSSSGDQFSGYERVNYTSPTGKLLTNYSSSGDQFSGYERVNYTSPTGSSSSGDQFPGYERVNYTSPTGRLLSGSSGDQFSGYERVNYTSPTGILSSNYNSSSGDQFSGYERVNYT